ITEYKRLENIRTEFVANVSHELRTPITSIKGFVETLMDGAKKNPEELDRFLSIITRQTARLNSIIEDLLSLAKIERNRSSNEIEFKEWNLKKIFSSVVELSELKASEKNIDLQIDCQSNLNTKVNRQLIEQALCNLVDNAIKYSKNNDQVIIVGKKSGSKIIMSVKDHGCGIEKIHFDRLFERFYRVDKARSRELGGTGLGLAIVKHIVQAHQGSVTVESEINKGSTFSLHLPAAAA
ncbi:MAG: ATP-binding protein, partial [Bdellovibrionales bacterium]|nr:ATP-binding protein [Bdellovibrionales bacterium]